MLTAQDVALFRAKLERFAGLSSFANEQSVLQELELCRKQLNDLLEQSSTMESDGPLKGWLMKRKRKDLKGNFTRWKKRFCVVLDDGIHYYETPASVVELGCIDAIQFEEITFAQNIVGINLKNGIGYELSALKSQDLSAWFEKLKSMKPVSAPHVPFRVICDGFLHKQKLKDGQFVGNKKLRYCVLSEFSLQYFDRRDGDLKGEMHLLGATLQKMTNDAGRVNGLRLLFPNGYEYEFTPFSPDAVEMLGIWSNSFEKVLKEFKRTEMADKFGPSRVSVAHLDGDYRLSSLGLTNSGSLPRGSSGGLPPALPPARAPQQQQQLQASGSGFRPGVAPGALSSSANGGISNVVSPGRGSQAAPVVNAVSSSPPPSIGTPPINTSNRGSVGFRPGIAPATASTATVTTTTATTTSSAVAATTNPGIAPVPLPRPPNSPQARHSGVVTAPATLTTPLSRNSGVGFAPGVGAAAPLSRNSGVVVPGIASAPAAAQPSNSPKSGSGLRSSSGNINLAASNSPDSPKRGWSSAMPSAGLVPPPALGSIPPPSPHREEPPSEEAPLPPVRNSVQVPSASSREDQQDEEEEESDEYVSIIKQ